MTKPSKSKQATMPVRALAPWFGSGRLIAPLVGRELAGCKWIGVPFAGGMSEIAEIDARSIAVNDLHRHVINLAMVVADREARREMMRRLIGYPFHPEVLRTAQDYCRRTEPIVWQGLDIPLATYYFVCCWMGRSASGGCPREFNGGISTRWNANGGDSNTRYRSALRGLAEWGRIMRRCSFTCLDAFEFLAKCQDTPETGIYVDAPWPDDGEKYEHKFTEDDQRRLAERLHKFVNARVVVRFGDHPLIRKLYPNAIAHPGEQWYWLPVNGRTQTNKTKREVLILNGPSRDTQGKFSDKWFDELRASGMDAWDGVDKELGRGEE
jgi:site-specific DNA-adenine methylase